VSTGVAAQPLKAPYPYFGGKSRVAAAIWERFGDVPNYVEPCAGSLAVPLARPHPAQTETFNDIDGWLVNFWRAVKADPDGVAEAADWPVSELDLHARGDWLFYRPDVADFIERMRADPEFLRREIGRLVAVGRVLLDRDWVGPRQMPHVSTAGQGVHRKMPHVGDAGPETFDTTTGASLRSYMRDLSTRFRRARLLCGDWSRAVSPAVTTGHGTTGVLLDPPYGQGNMEYAGGGNRGTIAADVHEWAVANGENPELRIAMCGYAGAFDMPDSWECFEWKQRKGYAATDEAVANCSRERVWFSPACLKPGGDGQFSLFTEGGAA
jgi:DNA adenine methylase